MTLVYQMLNKETPISRVKFARISAIFLEFGGDSGLENVFSDFLKSTKHSV
jgi:hypothetical protein